MKLTCIARIHRRRAMMGIDEASCRRISRFTEQMKYHADETAKDENAWRNAQQCW